MAGKQDTATSSLFAMAAQRDAKSQPLAYRMRPRTLDEYIGQDHIVGKGRLLRRAIQADQLSSVIFYGPPGTGKTTLARVIANTTKRHFSTLNAVLTGVKELREEIQLARQRMENYGQGTILFVDEVHRWNKSQQDALLPWVENGTVIFIGATTENPFFEVNAALVSRSRIFQLKALTGDDLLKIAQQALHDPERGYGKYHISFEEGALEHLVEVAGGDARSLLNALQLAVETSVEPFPPVDPQREILITKEAAEESIQRKVVLYDKEGDYHFDVISAFIKSLRGSDPDAALYWLAKMVAAGEDPRFIFRRMLISACEDIGLADPQAIVVVQADRPEEQLDPRLLRRLEDGRGRKRPDGSPQPSPGRQPGFQRIRTRGWIPLPPLLQGPLGRPAIPAIHPAGQGLLPAWRPRLRKANPRPGAGTPRGTDRERRHRRLPGKPLLLSWGQAAGDVGQPDDQRTGDDVAEAEGNAVRTTRPSAERPRAGAQRRFRHAALACLSSRS